LYELRWYFSCQDLFLSGFLLSSAMSSSFFPSSAGIVDEFLCGMATGFADGFLCGIADGLTDGFLVGIAAGFFILGMFVLRVEST
jgi:hypothetical protein